MLSEAWHGSRRDNDDDCFDETNYITCTTASTYNPSVCDCKRRWRCYIKFNITKVPDHPDTGIDPNDVFRINNGLVGPTIIARSSAGLVVDIFNNIVDAPGDDDISMHWHGMHQMNVPWMDGVGYVTQWPIPAGGRFRYIFRAKPAGTHWYHSHMRSQRDKGMYGALIVRERKRDIHHPNKLGRFEDEPGQKTLSIREHIKEEGASDSLSCFPDKSQMPELDEIVEWFQINGDKLDSEINEENMEPSFDVEPGKNYRFRLIGTMSQTILRFSIDHHKLYVMSTDGYLTHPFETDVLIMHVGERYDFILKADENIEPGTVYPIRIESVAVLCEDFSKPVRVGFAYLRYTKENSVKIAIVKKHESRCSKDRCVALNCPFKTYPKGASDVTLDCHDVYDVLSLLYPTSNADIPSATDISFEGFFNFGVQGQGVATVNNIQFKLHSEPFAQAQFNNQTLEMCEYQDTFECKSNPRPQCSHIVSIPKQHKMKTIRFVFSSVSSRSSPSSIRTHPMHLHGHSFFVAKIAYPQYDENGTIVTQIDDITIPNCGPGAWRNNVQPEGIRVDGETIRKDVIIVPAGGYVVVDFLADNPGWWFLHCHIDAHLSSGMGMVVDELPECHNPPPRDMLKQTRSFCYDVKKFLSKEKNNVCREVEPRKQKHKENNVRVKV